MWFRTWSPSGPKPTPCPKATAVPSESERSTAGHSNIFQNAIFGTREGKSNRDSNFSLQQACHDECASLQQVNESFEVTERTCSKLATNLPCKLIANYSINRVRTQPGIELAIYRSVA
ncbi:hypothetical protein AVEN_15085-1 [Araneus ventricosus]|uniref:Uncharacterized protein n=1 Tax=Araneus ventricosus TaxID=182803 RepID=A0A4Y2QE91_ARAVE|nr:hypothetical protein AVEN_15085-1 [Araneus ventricosus]